MSNSSIPTWMATATWDLVDPGNGAALDNDAWGQTRLVSTGAETRSMALPTAVGRRNFLVMETDGGDIVVTVAGGYDEQGNTTLTFNNTGEYAVLESTLSATGTYCWRLTGYDGVTGPEITYGDATISTLTATDIDCATMDATGNCTVGGTLGITGATTTAGITDSGTIAGTVGTFSSTLGITGTTTCAAINASGAYAGTSATLTSTLDVDGDTTLDITAVDGTLTMSDGGTVTQATSITTGVTLNTNSGQITTVSSTLAAGSNATFVVTNSNCAAIDTPIVTLGVYAGAGTPVVNCVRSAAGSFSVLIQNIHASSALDDTLTINFNLVKGSSS